MVQGGWGSGKELPACCQDKRTNLHLKLHHNKQRSLCKGYDLHSLQRSWSHQWVAQRCPVWGLWGHCPLPRDHTWKISQQPQDINLSEQISLATLTHFRSLISSSAVSVNVCALFTTFRATNRLVLQGIRELATIWLTLVYRFCQKFKRVLTAYPSRAIP